MAKIRFENGTVVNFSGTPTSADVEEVATKLGLQKRGTPDQPTGETGLKGFATGVAKGELSTLTGLGTMFSSGLSYLPGKVGQFFKGGAEYGKELQQTVLQPKSTAEKVGKTTEQIAEFFAPTGLVKKGEAVLKGSTLLAKYTPAMQKTIRILGGAGLEGLGAAGVTSAQTGGDLKKIAESGIYTTLFSVPFKALSVLKEPAVAALKTSANKKVAQALAPTTKENKILTEKVSQELLNKKVRFVTRGGLESKSIAAIDDLGEQIGAKFDTLPADAKNSVAPVINQIELLKNSYKIKGTNTIPEAAKDVFESLSRTQDEILSLGKNKLVETTIQNHLDEAKDVISSFGKDMLTRTTQTPEVLKRAIINITDGLTMDGLPEYAKAIKGVNLTGISSLDELGSAIKDKLLQNNLYSVSTESLRSYRQILDNIIKKTPKGGFGLTGLESAKLTATKASANAIRDVLAKDYPEIAALNKEYTFWKNVNKIIGDTIQRTKGQGTPLGETIAEGAGAAAGLIKGGTFGNALMTAVGFKLIKAVVTSPAWRMTSAISRNQLANALANGTTDQAINIINKIVAGSVSR
jgi:hypothetical protein